MGRPLLRLWRYLAPVTLPVVALAALVALDGTRSRLLPVAGVVVLVCQVRGRWIWRLAVRVRHFHTLAGGPVALYYDPEVVARYDLPALVQQAGADLDHLAAWFGRPLGHRPAVFLFADPAHISRVFGPEYGGAALTEATVVLVTAGGTVRESVRHELAHLFAARWNHFAPSLLAEGLAVWLQGTDQGEPIDTMAWPWVGEPGLNLRALLDRKVFFSESHRRACYLLSGSFTGFLLRRYGRAAYRRLYARASGRGFEGEFRRCLGASLDEAERQWRHEVLIAGPLGRPATAEVSPWAAGPGGAPGTGRASD